MSFLNFCGLQMWNVAPDNGFLLAACSAFIPTISGQTSARLLVEPENVSSASTEPAETVGEKEELSLLVVCAVTQELHTVGVHLHLCRSM